MTDSEVFGSGQPHRVPCGGSYHIIDRDAMTQLVEQIVGALDKPTKLKVTQVPALTVNSSEYFDHEKGQ